MVHSRHPSWRPAMPNAVLGAFLAATVAISSLVIALAVQQAEIGAQGPLTLAVDADPTGNTSTSVGSIEDCRSVEPGSTFDIDIVIMDVRDLLAWEATLIYDKSILKVTGADVRRFQAANAGSNVISASERLPDTDGRYYMGVADVSKASDSGSGVLARLTLEAIGTGVSEASLPQLVGLGPTLTNDSGQHIGDVNGDGLFDGPTLHAEIAVGTPCTSATPTPTPTPGAGQTPGPETATPTPDTDEDLVLGVSDQCPDTPASTSVDASGCSETQLEQLTQQAEAELLEVLTAGLNLDVSLDTVAIGGSTVVLAVFADENDEPASGVDITFKIKEQPGSDTNLEGEAEVTKTSDAEGLAEATLNVGSTPGEIVVSATAEGQTETVTVTVAAVESAAERLADRTEGTPGPPGTPPADGTPAASTLVAGQSGGGNSEDDNGQPMWIIAPIVGGLLALAVGTLAAWRSVRHRLD